MTKEEMRASFNLLDQQPMKGATLLVMKKAMELATVDELKLVVRVLTIGALSGQMTAADQVLAAMLYPGTRDLLMRAVQGLVSDVMLMAASEGNDEGLQNLIALGNHLETVLREIAAMMDAERRGAVG